MRSIAMVGLVALACRATTDPPVVPRPVADAPPPTALAPTEPAPSVPAPAVQAAHAFALAHVLPKGGDPFAPIIDGDAPPWSFVPITPPTSLARFHAALATAIRAPVRVAMFGASGTAADTHTAYVRAYLQSRFGDGGPGWVPLGRAKRWSRHAEIAITSGGAWEVMHAVQQRDGHVVALGLQGLAFEAKSSRAWVELRSRSGRGQAIRHIEIHALAQRKGGTMRVSIDGAPPSEHSTRAEVPALLRIPFEVEAGPHAIRIELAGNGPVRLFGAVLEDDRGAVVDTLGVDGARARNWQRWDPAIWREAMQRRPPALVTIAYGTNEAVDVDDPIAGFEAAFEQVIDRVRSAAPDADCVVLGPGDFPEQTGGQWRVRPRLVEIIAIERRIAAAKGCGFWDELAFMGGDGSMVRWVQSDPPLAREDHLHFTPRGAAVKGHELVDALVLGYDAAAP